MKANIYVDGFNLYYSALKGTPYRWLNLHRLCELMLQPGDTIHRIRYFTALVDDRQGNGEQQRQLTYLRALQTIPRLDIEYGKFLSGRVRMPLASPPASGPRTVEVLRTSEKGSDVNLATRLLADGFGGDYEVAIVISNDSDLKLPVQVVRDELHLPVGV